MRKKLLLCFIIIFSIFNVLTAEASAKIDFSKLTGNGKYNYGYKSASVYSLMCHKLSENPEEWSDFCISPQQFGQDIELLKNNGFTFITPVELQQELPDGKKYVLITFDDGYSSDYQYALPILEKYQVPATFFVVSSYIGTPGYVTEEELYTLAQNPYAVIGSHTNKIHDLSPIDVRGMIGNVKQQEYIEDIKASIEKLQSITGKPINCFSYPYGIYSKSFDWTMKANIGNLVTFSSDEVVNGTKAASDGPVGRFNRGRNFNFIGILN